jgi:hypothetical protein
MKRPPLLERAVDLVGQLNLAKLPTVPFGRLFVGKLWSEAKRLAYAYGDETATRHRKTPVLRAS